MTKELYFYNAEDPFCEFVLTQLLCQKSRRHWIHFIPTCTAMIHKCMLILVKCVDMLETLWLLFVLDAPICQLCFSTRKCIHFPIPLEYWVCLCMCVVHACISRTFRVVACEGLSEVHCTGPRTPPAQFSGSQQASLQQPWVILILPVIEQHQVEAATASTVSQQTH